MTDKKNKADGDGFRDGDDDIFWQLPPGASRSSGPNASDPLNRDRIFDHLQPARSTATEAQDHQDAVPESTILEIDYAETENGLPCYSGTSSQPESVLTLLNPVSQKHKLYWLVNAKGAKLNSSNDVLDPKNDLLAQFPDEITNENSLHLIKFDKAMPEPELRAALSSDAAVCISSVLDAEPLVEELKIVLAWFVRPSSLQFHLENGSGMLIDQLFANIGFIFLAGNEPTDSWKLFVDPKNPLDWESIGFPVSPTV